MLRLLALGLSLAVGIALGLISVGALLARDVPPFGAVRSGAWTAWPDAGTTAIDPYARAIFAHDGRTPISAAAGLRFIARRDDGGAKLDGRCQYTVGGPTPAAQYWTLTVLSLEGDARASPDPREGFTSAEVIRGSDGGFAITLARQARPGNWLPTRGDGPFQLMLSFYDTALATGLQNGGPVPPLPRITRTDCP